MILDPRDTFVRRVLAGMAQPSEIDDYVDEWHETYAGEVPIHIYLGMSEGEYAAWVQDPDALADILAAHRRGERSG